LLKTTLGQAREWFVLYPQSLTFAKEKYKENGTAQRYVMQGVEHGVRILLPVTK
jgi:hypothetical protein